MFVIAEQAPGRVSGVLYAKSDLGWWCGHIRGRVRRLFVPAAEPLGWAAILDPWTGTAPSADRCGGPRLLQSNGWN